MPREENRLSFFLLCASVSLWLTFFRSSYLSFAAAAFTKRSSKVFASVASFAAGGCVNSRPLADTTQIPRHKGHEGLARLLGRALPEVG